MHEGTVLAVLKVHWSSTSMWIKYRIIRLIEALNLTWPRALLTYVTLLSLAKIAVFPRFQPIRIESTYLNPFDTRCQYTDTLLQLEITALSIQIHDLTDDLLINWQCQYIDFSSVGPSMVLQVCGPRISFFYLSLKFFDCLDAIFFLVKKGLT